MPLRYICHTENVTHQAEGVTDIHSPNIPFAIGAFFILSKYKPTAYTLHRALIPKLGGCTWLWPLKRKGQGDGSNVIPRIALLPGKEGWFLTYLKPAPASRGCTGPSGCLWRAPKPGNE